MSGSTPDRDAADGQDEPTADARRAAETETGPLDCPYCDRRFARENWLALHEGLDHEPALSADERAAYEAARDDEREQLRLFRYKALAALVLLYFGFIMLYAVSL